MPRIISYTPSWLSRSSPGFELFNHSPSTLSLPNKDGKTQFQPQMVNGEAKTSGVEYTGPTKIIARRNTEVFVVVENQIRWSDLCMLKDNWTEQWKQKTQQQNREWRKSSTEHRKHLSEETRDASIEDPARSSYRVCK